MSSASDRRLLIFRAATILTVLSGVLLDTSASIAAEPHAYRIASGDRIAVTVFGQPELSSEAVVNQGGSQRLPIVGAVAAATFAKRARAERHHQVGSPRAAGVETSPVHSGIRTTRAAA